MNAPPTAAPDLHALCAALNGVLERAGKPPPLLLASEDAAEFLGVSRSKFFKLASEPTFPAAVRLAGANRFWRRRDLETFVERMKPSRRKPAK